MPEQLPEQLAPEAVADPAIRRVREYISAMISLIIILGTLVMMIQALNHVGTPEEFSRIKDLLLFINPLLGVVIGYYFNRVTSEARAETAETTAKSAMVSAQEATEARDKAETEAKEAQSKVGEVTLALKEVGQAAEKMAAQAPGTLSLDESGEPAGSPRVEFQMAWNRAKHLVE